MEFKRKWCTKLIYIGQNAVKELMYAFKTMSGFVVYTQISILSYGWIFFDKNIFALFEEVSHYTKKKKKFLWPGFKEISSELACWSMCVASFGYLIRFINWLIINEIINPQLLNDLVHNYRFYSLQWHKLLALTFGILIGATVL